MTLRFGDTIRTYMTMATIAGVAYGKVFQKSSAVHSSSGLHILVN